LGILVKNKTGQPYIQSCGTRTFTFGTVDLTSLEGAKWYAEEVIGKLMIRQSNTSGWMADFGEYLPFDAIFGAGVDPLLEHNRFPETWAKINRHAIQNMNKASIQLSLINLPSEISLFPLHPSSPSLSFFLSSFPSLWISLFLSLGPPFFTSLVLSSFFSLSPRLCALPCMSVLVQFCPSYSS